ncbi:tetratricopeptide repeat protein [bacterium]|nr:tetratricopeptide repeat protein [bacterium]
MISRSFLVLLLISVLSCMVYSNTGQVNQSGWSELKKGYNKAYKTYYPIAYEQGFNSGLAAGEKDGYRKGMKDGMEEIYKQYSEFEYTLKIDEYSDKNIIMPEELQGVRNVQKWYDFGYSAGERSGKCIGYSKGFSKGRKKSQPIAYKKGFRHGKYEACKELFYNHTSQALTDIQQLELSIDYIQIGELALARNHLNVIIRDMNPSIYRKDALFHVGRVHEKLKNSKSAIQCYLIFLEDNEGHAEYYKVAIRAIRLLKGLKTGGFMMIGRKTYYKMTSYLAEKIVNDTNLGELIPEACYIAGKCYEKLDEKNLAREMYNKIILDYPASPFFKNAKKRLNKI